MLGGSSGPNIGRTAVGVRTLANTQPATPGAIAKKSPVEERHLDRVDRDAPDRKNPVLALLEEEERDESGEEELAQPPGHGSGQRFFHDEPFRSDPRGRIIHPTFGDVDQGNLSDAWLLAALASVAALRPIELLKRVGKTEDGNFVITLGRDEVLVRPEFPNERYADPTPNEQRDTLWVALFEKAFAQREAGSYANLEQGNPGRALELLTGRPSRRLTITEHSDKARIFTLALEARKKNRPMVLRTREAEVSRLHPDHAYAVIDVLEKDGKRFFKLYNPWGTKSNTRTLASMIDEASLEVVMADAEAIHVSTL